MLIADLLQSVLIRVVPGALSQQEVSVLERSLVSHGVDEDLRPPEGSSEVIDSLYDLTPDLAHPVKLGQVSKLRISVKVQRIVIIAIIGLQEEEASVSSSNI